MWNYGKLWKVSFNIKRIRLRFLCYISIAIARKLFRYRHVVCLIILVIRRSPISFGSLSSVDDLPLFTYTCLNKTRGGFLPVNFADVYLATTLAHNGTFPAIIKIKPRFIFRHNSINSRLNYLLLFAKINTGHLAFINIHLRFVAGLNTVTIINFACW